MGVSPARPARASRAVSDGARPAPRRRPGVPPAVGSPPWSRRGPASEAPSEPRARPPA